MWKIYAKVPLNAEFPVVIMSVSTHSSDPPMDEEKAAEACLDELDQPIWSVISFERCEVAELVYEEAFVKLTELEARGIAGLCIVTDTAAARVAGRKN